MRLRDTRREDSNITRVESRGSLLAHACARRGGRGGPRRGAGRPRGKRPRVLHRRRERVPAGAPVHVTLRVRRELPRLRQRKVIDQLRRTFVRGCERGAFRLVHYSVQNDHAHLIVEASGKKALECGMKSIGARFARAINRAFARSGPVLDGRYHAVILRTPTQVRRTLRYVLLNARKHRVSFRGIDPASSGPLVHRLEGRFPTGLRPAGSDGGRYCAELAAEEGLEKDRPDRRRGRSLIRFRAAVGRTCRGPEGRSRGNAGVRYRVRLEPKRSRRSLVYGALSTPTRRSAPRSGSTSHRGASESGPGTRPTRRSPSPLPSIRT